MRTFRHGIMLEGCDGGGGPQSDKTTNKPKWEVPHPCWLGVTHPSTKNKITPPFLIQLSAMNNNEQKSSPWCLRFYSPILQVPSYLSQAGITSEMRYTQAQYRTLNRKKKSSNHSLNTPPYCLSHTNRVPPYNCPHMIYCLILSHLLMSHTASTVKASAGSAGDH